MQGPVTTARVPHSYGCCSSTTLGNLYTALKRMAAAKQLWCPESHTATTAPACCHASATSRVTSAKPSFTIWIRSCCREVARCCCCCCCTAGSSWLVQIHGKGSGNGLHTDGHTSQDCISADAHSLARHWGARQRPTGRTQISNAWTGAQHVFLIGSNLAGPE
jgi:hypothetical protein